MSGGVDSSVAAALLKDQGFDVVGCFMRLGSPGDELDTPLPATQACKPGVKIGHRGCCSVGDAADARLVAAHLDIPLYVVNFRSEFGRIIDYFVDEYARGRTPNPCVRCNDWLKFGKLHEYALQIGASFIASGHYARIQQHDDQLVLLRGVDEGKDQSYVLFGVPWEQLSRMMLPIGKYTKAEIRTIAKERNLPVFDKPDSQEICFVPDDDYAGLIESRRPEISQPGNIVDTQGNTVGQHQGQHRFTIGQRRGVGVAFGYPIYVVGKDPQHNTVTIGSKQDLLAMGCEAAEANWLVDTQRFADWVPCFAQIRYNSAAVSAQVKLMPEDTNDSTHSGRIGRFSVRFDQPVEAVTPGQVVVIYDANEPELVLGGGWITRAVDGQSSSK